MSLTTTTTTSPDPRPRHSPLEEWLLQAWGNAWEQIKKSWGVAKNYWAERLILWE